MDFFDSGATSQDVTRLIEETRFKTGAELENIQVASFLSRSSVKENKKPRILFVLFLFAM